MAKKKGKKTQNQVNFNQRGSYADAHVHFDEPNEFCKSLGFWTHVARENNIKFVATKHNSAHQDTIAKYGLDPLAVTHTYQGATFNLGIEVTCRDDTNPTGAKLHLMVIAPKLTPESPIVKLMQIKSRNDTLVDHGLIYFVSRLYGLNPEKKDILSFATRYSNGRDKIVTFGREKTYDFFMENNLNPCTSSRALFNLLEHSPSVRRVNLYMSDVIKIAHASGALVVMAHPGASLRRLSNAEIKSTVENFLILGGDGFERIYSANNTKVDNIVHQVVTEMGAQNDVIFTVGSDAHVVQPNATISKPHGYRGNLKVEDMQKFFDELGQLEQARAKGLLSHRTYAEMGGREIDDILTRAEAKVIAEEAAYRAKFEEQKEYLFGTPEPEPELVVEQPVEEQPKEAQQFDGGSIIADVVDPTIDDDMLL